MDCKFPTFGDVVGIEEYCEHLQIPISHVPSLQSLSFVVLFMGLLEFEDMILWNYFHEKSLQV